MLDGKPSGDGGGRGEYEGAARPAAARSGGYKDRSAMDDEIAF